jgi:hypothetical protein
LSDRPDPKRPRALWKEQRSLGRATYRIDRTHRHLGRPFRADVRRRSGHAAQPMRRSPGGIDQRVGCPKERVQQHIPGHTSVGHAELGREQPNTPLLFIVEPHATAARAHVERQASMLPSRERLVAHRTGQLVLSATHFAPQRAAVERGVTSVAGWIWRRRSRRNASPQLGGHVPRRLPHLAAFEPRPAAARAVIEDHPPVRPLRGTFSFCTPRPTGQGKRASIGRRVSAGATGL